MPASQSAPELRLDADDRRLRLEDLRRPSPRARAAFGLFLYAAPVLVVALWALRIVFGGAQGLGCLLEGLSSVVGMVVFLTWWATLTGDKLLRELEIERGTGRLRAHASSYFGSFRREIELDGAAIRSLRLETPLAERYTIARWGEVVTLLRQHWGDRMPPSVEREQEIEDAIIVRAPVLRLIVEAADGATDSFLFRVEGLMKGGEVRELLERMAGALGLPEVQVEWSDQRRVSLRAGRAAVEAEDSGAPHQELERPADAAAVPGSLPDRLPSVGVGFRLPRHRILVWKPGRRIVIRRRFGWTWTVMLPPMALVLATPLLAWLVGLLGTGTFGSSLRGEWIDFWPTAVLWLTLLLPFLLLGLWLCRPRRLEIDWAAGMIRRQETLRRRELVLSRVGAVRLREKDPGHLSEVEDPEVFYLELLPRETGDVEPFHLLAVHTSLGRNRECVHSALAPLAAALAAALQVPCQMQGPGEWERGLK